MEGKYRVLLPNLKIGLFDNSITFEQNLFIMIEFSYVKSIVLYGIFFIPFIFQPNAIVNERIIAKIRKMFIIKK